METAIAIVVASLITVAFQPRAETQVPPPIAIVTAKAVEAPVDPCAQYTDPLENAACNFKP